MFLGALIFVALWSAIAWLLRCYPETMAGYNTMPKKEREKIDIQKLGRFVSNAMLVGVPAALLSPLMPTKALYALLLCWIPCAIVIVAGIYVNVCKKKFEK